jgi:hypothetical protein
MPPIGGATPTIVPLSFDGIGAGVPSSAPGGAPAAGGGAAPGGVGGRGTPPGLFIMSIVPLNFGAAAPFKLKLHLLHVAAVSGF